MPIIFRRSEAEQLKEGEAGEDGDEEDLLVELLLRAGLILKRRKRRGWIPQFRNTQPRSTQTYPYDTDYAWREYAEKWTSNTLGK